MTDWTDAAVFPQIDLGDAVEVWVCVKDRSGVLRTKTGYFVNHPLAQMDDDDEYPDWVSLNCDGEPADFVGFATLTSHPDYDGYYEPLAGVTHWSYIEYPAAPASV